MLYELLLPDLSAALLSAVFVKGKSQRVYRTLSISPIANTPITYSIAYKTIERPVPGLTLS